MADKQTTTRVRLGHPKLCAVCGNTCYHQVVLVWQRPSDNKLFDVCLACAQKHAVNETSVDKFGPSPYQSLRTHRRWSAKFMTPAPEDGEQPGY